MRHKKKILIKKSRFNAKRSVPYYFTFSDKKQASKQLCFVQKQGNELFKIEIPFLKMKIYLPVLTLKNYVGVCMYVYI